MESLEALWAELLSGNAQRVRRAWDSLEAGERRAVLEHLMRMRDDTGWHPAQREAAAAAIEFVAGASPPTD